MTADPALLLRGMFGAPGHVWSAGTMTAFAGMEIVATPAGQDDRPVVQDATTAARLAPEAFVAEGGRPVAFETLSSDPRGWNHGIALCLPASPASPAPPPARLTAAEDGDAINPRDRGRQALDLGIGQRPVRALFRPDDPAMLAQAGRFWPDAAPVLAAAPGVWIIDTPALRIERRAAGAIGLHFVEAALTSGLSHAATTPVPEGMMPVAHVFPPHPARSRPGGAGIFDPARYGRAELWALKCAVLSRLRDGGDMPPDADRHRLAVIRVALRQQCRLGAPPPRCWLERFDRPLLQALEIRPPG